MNGLRTMTFLGLLLVAAGPLCAQDDDTAAERARLANERIQLEAQRRAEEERRREAREAAAASEAPGESAESAPRRSGSDGTASGRARPETSPAPSRADEEQRTSRALEQLRELGELRDAGYVTEEEFARIKARILDSRF